MAIFPIIDDVIIQNDIILDRGINFLYDFNLGDLVLKDGKFIELTGDAAVVFWIEKTLRTEYERATVYQNTGYGTTLEVLRGSVLPKEIARNMLESNIKNSLLTHERINSINNFTFQQENDKVTISFAVKLNAVTEDTESNYAGSEQGYTRLDTLEDIKNFLGIKMVTNDSFAFSTTLSL